MKALMNLFNFLFKGVKKEKYYMNLSFGKQHNINIVSLPIPISKNAYDDLVKSTTLSFKTDTVIGGSLSKDGKVITIYI